MVSATTVLPVDLWLHAAFALYGAVEKEETMFLEQFCGAWRTVSRAWQQMVDQKVYWVCMDAIERLQRLERVFGGLQVAHCAVSAVGALEGRVALSVVAATWTPPANPLHHPLWGVTLPAGLERLQAIDLSETEADDASVSAVCHYCQHLVELRLLRCANIQAPRFEAATRMVVLEVDGCHKIDFQRLARLDIDVDILVDDFNKLDVVDVVILSGTFAGSWVGASVVAQRGPFAYDIAVHDTSDYDCAIGFSGCRVRNIARHHLRVPGRLSDRRVLRPLFTGNNADSFRKPRPGPALPPCDTHVRHIIHSTHPYATLVGEYADLSLPATLG